MKNLFKKKWFKIVLAVVAAFILFQIILAIVITVVSSTKSYRIIKLEEYSGDVTISRKNAFLELFNGLQLLSGDESATGEESVMSLLIDSDKHMLVTPNTKFEVKATGSEEKGKVKIDIQEGKAFFDIENKLNGNSSFDVITPNATTSIRGTDFAVTYDSADLSTHVFVDHGTVEVFYGNNQSILVNDKEAVTIKDGTATKTTAQFFQINRSYDVFFPDYMNRVTNRTEFFDDYSNYSGTELSSSPFEQIITKHTADMDRKLNEYAQQGETYPSENVSTWFPDYFVSDVGNGPERFRVEKAVYIGMITLDPAYATEPMYYNSITEDGRYLIGLSVRIYVISEGPAGAEELEAAPVEGMGGEELNNSPYAGLAAGDFVEFGAYEQDGNEDNGKEPIEWQVLTNEDGRLYLISKYVLDCKPYHNKTENVTWETCSLRAWLNDEFLNAAFSAEEMTQIPSVTLECDDNPNYGTDGGNDTTDKVFVPSLSEIKQYIYDWGNENGGASYDLFIKPTQYALNNGCKYLTTIDRAWYNSEFKKYGYPESVIGERSSCWWLRTPSYNQMYVSVVSIAGQVGYASSPADTDHAPGAGSQPKVYVGVRPAIYLEY